MTRADDVLTYLQDNAEQVNKHDGAAFVEAQILKACRQKEPCVNYLAAASMASLERSAIKIADRGQAYRFTHDIMFASDFGRVSLTVDDGFPKLLDDAIPQFFDDPDVLCELVMCAIIIGHQSDVITEGQKIFWEMFDALDRSPETFNENYHILLVGGLLSSLVE